MSRTERSWRGVGGKNNQKNVNGQLEGRMEEDKLKKSGQKENRDWGATERERKQCIGKGLFSLSSLSYAACSHA